MLYKSDFQKSRKNKKGGLELLTVIIGVLYVAVIIPCISNGKWLGAGIATAILLFLMLCSAEEREDRKAYFNWRNYWANGGPNDMRRRK